MANGAGWSISLTRGLWGLVQGLVRDGVAYRDAWEAIHRAGERPDAATFGTLWSRAVGGSRSASAEAEYRARVDRQVYLGRRPSGGIAETLPFSVQGRWRQVVEVFGSDVASGDRRSIFVNIDTDRLITRGEAIEQATAELMVSPIVQLFDIEGAEYHTTWRSGPWG